MRYAWLAAAFAVTLVVGLLVGIILGGGGSRAGAAVGFPASRQRLTGGRLRPRHDGPPRPGRPDGGDVVVLRVGWETLEQDRESADYDDQGSS
jgi:hypothetical protein